MSEEKEMLDPMIIEMLHEMEVVFNQNGIDYYLVGALARDLQLLCK